MKRFLLYAFLIAAASAWAQAPVLDGVISSGEYSFIETRNGINVGASLSPDKKTLYLYVSAQTSGWVSVGVGSGVMDGAYMVLGYVSEGKENVLYELGRGRSHSPSFSEGVMAKVLEASGVTTMEVSMPVGSSLKGGQIQLILAIGSNDNPKMRHSARASTTVRF